MKESIALPFKSYGRAYVRRGQETIPLPENTEDSGFALKDGDILGTERSSYVYDLKDRGQRENDRTDIVIFPRSEMRLRLMPTAPGSLKSVELLSGLFFVGLERKGSDANHLVKIESSYPKIRFESAAANYANILDDLVEKMRAQNPQMAEMLVQRMESQKAPAAESRCGDISGFIELTEAGEIVLTRISNRLVHEGIGKETKKILTDPMKPIKITVTKDALYETDCARNPDPRVEAIIKIPMMLPALSGAMAGRINLGRPVPEPNGRPEDAERMKMIDEAAQMLKDAEAIGDRELISMAKTRLETSQKFAGGLLQEISAAEKEAAKRALTIFERQIPEFKLQLETEFPPYSRPPETERV